MAYKTIYPGVKVELTKAIGKLRPGTTGTIVVADDYKLTIRFEVDRRDAEFYVRMDEFNADFRLQMNSYKNYEYPQDSKGDSNRSALNYTPADFKPHSREHLYNLRFV